MKRLHLLVYVITWTGISHGSPALYETLSPYYDGLEVAAAAPIVSSIQSQFHTQDELGQYSYGYNDGLSSKIESKTADGITKGSYSYVDANGIIQNVHYTADDVNGFRVSGTNLPISASLPVLSVPIHRPEPLPLITMPADVHHSDHHYADAQEEEIYDEVSPQEPNNIRQIIMEDNHRKKTEESANKPKKTEEIHRKNDHTEEITQKTRDDSSKNQQKKQPVSNENKIVKKSKAEDTNEKKNNRNKNLRKPVYKKRPSSSRSSSRPSLRRPEQDYAFHSSTYMQPAVQYYPSFLPPVYNQYHAQDQFGQYSYGYSGGTSAKNEMRSADGVTHGGYSYIDPNGILQRVNYVADPVHGFRVAASNLPSPQPAYIAHPFQYDYHNYLTPEINSMYYDK